MFLLDIAKLTMQTMVKPVFFVFALTLLTYGCDSQVNSESDQVALIQTDEVSYTLVPEGGGLATEISYSFENRTGGKVYLVNCNGQFGLHLERLEDGEWKTVWAPVLQECLSPPIVIDEESVFQSKVNVWGGFPESNVLPQFSDSVPAGTYRIVWNAALSSYQDDTFPFGSLIGLDHRISNVFEIRVE